MINQSEISFFDLSIEARCHSNQFLATELIFVTPVAQLYSYRYSIASDTDRGQGACTERQWRI